MNKTDKKADTQRQKREKLLKKKYSRIFHSAKAKHQVAFKIITLIRNKET